MWQEALGKEGEESSSLVPSALCLKPCLFLEFELDFYTAISGHAGNFLCTLLDAFAVCDGIFFTASAQAQHIGVNAHLGVEIGLGCLGAFDRKLLVVAVGADFVRIADDTHFRHFG